MTSKLPSNYEKNLIAIISPFSHLIIPNINHLPGIQEALVSDAFFFPLRLYKNRPVNHFQIFPFIGHDDQKSRERVNERVEKKIDLLWVFKMFCINFDRDLQQRKGFHSSCFTFYDVTFFAIRFVLHPYRNLDEKLFFLLSTWSLLSELHSSPLNIST